MNTAATCIGVLYTPLLAVPQLGLNPSSCLRLSSAVSTSEVRCCSDIEEDVEAQLRSLADIVLYRWGESDDSRSNEHYCPLG